MPGFAKAAIDAWMAAAGITDGLVFRSMNNRHELTGNPLLAQNIMDAVIRYGAEIGADRLAPHDLGARSPSWPMAVTLRWNRSS